MSDPVLTPTAYLIGLAWLAVAAVACAVVVRAVDRRWLEGWLAAERGVGWAVVVLALLTTTSQALAAVGLLKPVPMLIGLMAVAALVHGGFRRAQAPVVVLPPDGDRPPPPSHPVERSTALLAVAAVGAQWVAHSADALDRGMTHADTLWYHGPYTARFLQTGSIGDLTGLGYGQSRYFPLGSELLHAVVALPLSRDLLSPLLNLGFFGLAILAAAAIGARLGSAALSVLGATMVLGLPTLAGTQPGQASNDVVAASLVLACIALLLRADHSRVTLALAGVALGLAAGTKVTVLALAGPIAVGIVVVLIRTGRRPLVHWWIGGTLLPSAGWAVRNVVLTGTPVPFLDLRLGPVHHVAVAPPRGSPSIVRTLLEGAVGGYQQGLERGFGLLWPVVLLAAGAGMVWSLGSRDAHARRSVLRVCAAAAVIGAVAYPFTPYTGGLSFQFNLRYLTPPLVVGVVLLTARTSSSRRGRLVALIALATTLGVNLWADHHERVEAWPGHPGIALIAAGGILAIGATAGRGAPMRRWWRVSLAGTVMSVVVGGWMAQGHYLTHRYVQAGLDEDRINAAFRTVSGARVEVLGTPEVYPMFGADLSNDVRDRSAQLYLDVEPPDDPCVHWRRELAEADYVVASMAGFALRRFTPEERVDLFERDPAIEVVVRDRSALYRLTGSLDPSRC